MNGEAEGSQREPALDLSLSSAASSPGRPRSRRSSAKSDIILPPYPWATKRRATVHRLSYLVAHGINTITGRVKCKHCSKQFDIEYGLLEKFREVAAFILANREEMRHRAPHAWLYPVLPDCQECEQPNCLKPVMGKKKNINWLFLFLGQMVGCCKLSELKYFCKHTKLHRTGAKDRVLYLTFLEIWSQLDPRGSFRP